MIKAPAWLGGIQTACVQQSSTRVAIHASTPISSGWRSQRQCLASLVVASKFAHDASRRASTSRSRQNNSTKPLSRFFVIKKCTPRGALVVREDVKRRTIFHNRQSVGRAFGFPPCTRLRRSRDFRTRSRNPKFGQRSSERARGCARGIPCLD